MFFIFRINEENIIFENINHNNNDNEDDMKSLNKQKFNNDLSRKAIDNIYEKRLCNKKYWNKKNALIIF